MLVACAGGEDEGEVARVKGGTEDEEGRIPIVVAAVDPSIPMTPIFGSNLLLRSCLL